MHQKSSMYSIDSPQWSKGTSHISFDMCHGLHSRLTCRFVFSNRFKYQNERKKHIPRKIEMKISQQYVRRLRNFGRRSPLLILSNNVIKKKMIFGRSEVMVITAIYNLFSSCSENKTLENKQLMCLYCIFVRLPLSPHAKIAPKFRET